MRESKPTHSSKVILHTSDVESAGESELAHTEQCASGHWVTSKGWGPVRALLQSHSLLKPRAKRHKYLCEFAFKK